MSITRFLLAALITTPDPQAFLLNHSTSVAIDAAGNLVIVYAV